MSAVPAMTRAEPRDGAIQIFDPDYKDEEDVVTEETFSILNVPQENVRGTKRKRNNLPVSRNDAGGKYPCEQCDYEYKKDPH